ncbi:MAG: hypothetical protein EBR82_81270 [Caulobacteraceae bacterium]|nr:hypothetical protein [Caulobacteraceae bacterium]
MTLDEIRAQLKVVAPSAKTKLRQADEAVVERDQLIRRAHNAGMTYREIAELVNLSHQRVAQIANR